MAVGKQWACPGSYLCSHSSRQGCGEGGGRDTSVRVRGNAMPGLSLIWPQAKTMATYSGFQNALLRENVCCLPNNSHFPTLSSAAGSPIPPSGHSHPFPSCASSDSSSFPLEAPWSLLFLTDPLPRGNRTSSMPRHLLLPWPFTENNCVSARNYRKRCFHPVEYYYGIYTYL